MGKGTSKDLDKDPASLRCCLPSGPCLLKRKGTSRHLFRYSGLHSPLNNKTIHQLNIAEYIYIYNECHKSFDHPPPLITHPLLPPVQTTHPLSPCAMLSSAWNATIFCSAFYFLNNIEWWNGGKGRETRSRGKCNNILSNVWMQGTTRRTDKLF